MRYVRPPATFIEDAYRRADRKGGPCMRVRWKLRMAAAQHEVWTGAQLRRLLADKAGLEMSAASVSTSVVSIHGVSAASLRRHAGGPGCLKF
jgi:hypothetical protein